MTDDLVQRLREDDTDPKMLRQAADRIDAQAAEIDKLRGIVAVWLDLAVGPDEMGDYLRQKWAIEASKEALEQST